MLPSAQAGRRVLACDDEPQILRALKVILRNVGYEVLAAGDMPEALEGEQSEDRHEPPERHHDPAGDVRERDAVRAEVAGRRAG
jgi:hypothetical protein